MISDGLQLGSFDARGEAEALARRMAEAAAVGVPVHLHLQAEDGELHREDIVSSQTAGNAAA